MFAAGPRKKRKALMRMIITSRVSMIKRRPMDLAAFAFSICFGEAN